MNAYCPGCLSPAVKIKYHGKPKYLCTKIRCGAWGPWKDRAMLRPKFTVEWRERGQWVQSQNHFRSKRAATNHAAIIAARKFRIVPIK